MLASTNSKIMREKAEEETISLQSSPAQLYARLAVQLASYRLLRHVVHLRLW